MDNNIEKVQKQRLINISGGGIEIITLMSAFSTLIKSGLNFSYLTGVSAGAIIGFCSVCGKMNEAYDLIKRTHDKRVIFSWMNDPTGPISGLSISAIIKILQGKNYIGRMDNLEANLKRIVTREDFKRYQSDDKSVDFYVLVTRQQTGKKKLVSIRHMNYDLAIDYVIASASIAPTIKSRNIMGIDYNDGGHRDSSAGGEFLESFDIEIDECVTIFSRPSQKELDVLPLGRMSNFFKRLQNFTIGLFLREASLNDEYREAKECEKRGIEYSPIHLSNITDEVYTITKEEIKKGIQIGKAAANKYLTDKKS